LSCWDSLFGSLSHGEPKEIGLKDARFVAGNRFFDHMEAVKGVLVRFRLQCP